MPEVKGTIEIGRPVEEVFDYLADPKNNLDWEKSVEANELTSDGPMGLGSKGRRVENFFGRDESVWEVAEWRPNELAAFKAESDKFVGDFEWRTESADSGTRVTYRFSGSAKNPFFKLLMPLMMSFFKRQISKDYQKLKEILESRS